MIETVVERWHSHLRGDLPGGLDDLLDDDVVFYSPVVYTPQRGKDITKLYLQAAGVALPGDGSATASFAYTKQVLAGDTAVLEFETTVAGKYVNRLDIIPCHHHGRLVEFRRMTRPLQTGNG